MPPRAQRKLARQTLDLSMAVPQVIAHRVGRTASAGSRLNARDRKEFHLMSVEKTAAFYESWAAMGMAAVQAQQSMWCAALFTPWMRATLPSASTLARHTLQIMSQGMAPLHRRAVGNAKRLGRVNK